ncbi:MAG TPA: hypothetical protein VMT11_07095 [Myxococcaceae bacterium]|nr:hypothetical protein [Myxococcaceae bacterium]
MIARVLGVLLGAAVFASAFLQPTHSPVFWHDLLIGGLVALVSFMGIWAPRLRFINVAVAVWLFWSGAVLPNIDHFHVTVLAATLIFIFSLVPNSDETFWPHHHLAHHH